jgi:protein-tyrosine phosphatase
MRNIIHTILMLASAAAVLLSCNREKEQEVQDATDCVYRFELAEGETRATLGEDGVFWEVDKDNVGLYLGAAHGEAEVIQNGGTKYVQFTAAASASGKVYAYYPYQSANTDPASTQVEFPASQQGASVSAMPMAGVPFNVQSGDTNGKIHFLNLGAVIDFRVYSAKYAGERVQSITFTVNAGEHPACGEATIDLTQVSAEDDGSLNVTWSGSNPSSVTLSEFATTAAVKDVAANGHMYMVVAPGTYTSGTITVVTNAASYTFPFQNKTLARNTITRYNMNLDSSNATRVMNESYYVKVNSADQLVDGGQYLIVYESGKQAFKPILNGNNLVASTANCQQVMISNDRIQSSEDVDACRVVLTKAANSGYYMQAVAVGGYYFYPSGSNIVAGLTASTACTIEFVSNGVVNITAGNNNYFKYSTYSSYFKGSTSNSSRELALFLRESGSGQIQTLNFSASTFSCFLNENPVSSILSGTPTLSGAQTDVKYSSSNTSVATVDLTSGAVTVQGLGETIIAATADATDTYQGGMASYKLTVYPEPVYSIENDPVAAFLDYEGQNPYDPSDYSYTYVMDYRGGTSDSNRLDVPKPVPVTWTTSASNATVVIYNDPAHTDEEIMAFTEKETSTSVQVYNLIPGRTYYYVVKDGAQQLKEGSFKTTGRRRMIKVGRNSAYGATHANNCRDLGGLPAMNGKTVKFGKLYRGTNMDATSDDQKDYLINKMGIRLDVDLRAKGNGSGGSTKASTPALDGNTVYRTYDEEYDHWASNNPSNDSKALNNPNNMKKTLGYIFQYIHEGKAAYIHCKIGSDRTAYVCLLLEAILGVPQHLCDVDYELTSFSYSTDDHLPRRRDEDDISWYYYTRNGIPSITSASGSTFQEKAINYVKAMGITDAQIATFQSDMLE